MLTKKEWNEVLNLYKDASLNKETLKEKLNISSYAAERILFAIRNNFVPANTLLPEKLSSIQPIKFINFLKKRRTLLEIAGKFKLSSEETYQLIEHFKSLHHKIILEDNSAHALPYFDKGRMSLNPKMFDHKHFKFGLVSDSHFGSHWTRAETLNLLYDIFEKEGITMVFHGGNLIEGESHFNKQDVRIFGLTNQVNFLIKNYPVRNGITTYFISADDHEGWYSQKLIFNIGDYIQNARESLNLYDMKHLGYLEADIKLTDKKDGWDNETWMRIIHPGGGTAYAVSYQAQKLVESLQGGEKPNIMGIGHYHKFNYCEIRNVHTILIPCTSDQSIFMRKKYIEAVIGGVIVEGNIDAYGVLNRLKIEKFGFYDKAFYVGKDKYQKYI